MNDNNSLSDRTSPWKRIKRPAAFMLVCFAAALGLLFLQTEKSDFEKINNAPLVIVEQSYKEQVTEGSSTYNAELAAQTKAFRIASSDAVINEVKKEQFKKLFPNYPKYLEEIKVLFAVKLDKEMVKKSFAGRTENNIDAFSADIDKFPDDEKRKKLIEKLSSDKNTQDIDKLFADYGKLRQSELSSIINKSITKVQHETFKNEDELINKVYQVTKKLEEAKLKELENDYAAAEKNLSDAEAQETLFQNFRNENPSLGAENLKIKISESSLNYSASLVNSLNEIKKAEKKMWEKPDSNPIKDKITETLKSKKEAFSKNLESITKKINGVDENFETVYGLVFKTLKNRDVIDKNLFVKTEQNPFLKNIFDDKKGLSVVYWVMEITLKVVIVLALLFVILIPLKHIFFITTSSDYLVDQGRKSMDKVGAATIGLTTISKAIIVTTATIGIGAAALAGQTLSANAEPDNSQAAANTPMPIRKDQPEKSAVPQNQPTTLQPLPEIAALRAEIKTLQQTITDFSDSINRTDLVDLKERFENVEANTNKLIEVVGTKEDFKDNGTIAGYVKNFSTELGNRHKETLTELQSIKGEITAPTTNASAENLYTKIENVSKLIGGKTEADNFSNNFRTTPNDSPKNLTQAFGTIWSLLGAKEFVDKKNQPNLPITANPKTYSLFETLQTVNQNIGEPNHFEPIPTTSFSTIPDNQLPRPVTLFGKINYVSSSIGTYDYMNPTASSIYTTLGKLNNPPNPAAPSLLQISKEIESNTSDIGRYVLGGEGGSFFSQLKNLGSGERYLVTDFSVAVLEKFYETDADVLDILKVFEAKLKADKAELEKYNIGLKANQNLPKPHLTFLNKPLSEKDITNGLEFEKTNPNAEKWKKVKPKILRYLRVTRY